MLNLRNIFQNRTVNRGRVTNDGNNVAPSQQQPQQSENSEPPSPAQTRPRIAPSLPALNPDQAMPAAPPIDGVLPSGLTSQNNLQTPGAPSGPFRLAPVAPPNGASAAFPDNPVSVIENPNNAPPEATIKALPFRLRNESSQPTMSNNAISSDVSNVLPFPSQIERGQSATGVPFNPNAGTNNAPPLDFANFAQTPEQSPEVIEPKYPPIRLSPIEQGQSRIGELEQKRRDLDAAPVEDKNGRLRTGLKAGLVSLADAFNPANGIVRDWNEFAARAAAGAGGFAGGMINKKWDEYQAKERDLVQIDKNLSRENQSLAALYKNDERETARQTNQIRLAGIPEQRKREQEKAQETRRSQLLTQISKLKNYKRGENPQFDAQLDEAGLVQPDFTPERKMLPTYRDANGILMTYEQGENGFIAVPVKKSDGSFDVDESLANTTMTVGDRNFTAKQKDALSGAVNLETGEKKLEYDNANDAAKAEQEFRDAEAKRTLANQEIQAKIDGKKTALANAQSQIEYHQKIIADTEALLESYETWRRQYDDDELPDSDKAKGADYKKTLEKAKAEYARYLKTAEDSNAELTALQGQINSTPSTRRKVVKRSPPNISVGGGGKYAGKVYASPESMKTYFPGKSVGEIRQIVEKQGGRFSN